MPHRFDRLLTATIDLAPSYELDEIAEKLRKDAGVPNLHSEE